MKTNKVNTQPMYIKYAQIKKGGESLPVKTEAAMAEKMSENNFDPCLDKCNPSPR